MLFLSGLLQGHLFPEFNIVVFDDPPTIQNLTYFFMKTYPKGPLDFAKFAFWSFVAGFSERFVPQIIGKIAPKE
jgi:hypothetical protein